MSIRPSTLSAFSVVQSAPPAPPTPGSQGTEWRHQAGEVDVAPGAP